MSNPVFEFDLRLTAQDPSGYYYPRWDIAEKITVRAATKQEAVNKAAKALGKASYELDIDGLEEELLELVKDWMD